MIQNVYLTNVMKNAFKMHLDLKKYFLVKLHELKLNKVIF